MKWEVNRCFLYLYKTPKDRRKKSTESKMKRWNKSQAHNEDLISISYPLPFWSRKSLHILLETLHSVCCHMGILDNKWQTVYQGISVRNPIYYNTKIVSRLNRSQDRDLKVSTDPYLPYFLYILGSPQ